MASLRGTRYFITSGLVLAGVALGACTSIPFLSGSSDIKKLYVKDYTLNVDSRLIAGTSSKDFEDLKSQNVRDLGNVGLVYSPNYIFVADPQLLIAATSPISLPSDQIVTEPQKFDAKGNLVTEQVLRKPLYVINKTTLSYTVPGFTIPQVTITQQIPIKSNSYQLKLGGVAQVNELMAAFAQDPAKIGSVAGSVTIALDITDADPLAFEKTFVVARTLPLVYSYLPFKPETDQSPQPTPFGIPTFPGVTSAPSSAPSSSATPAPVATTLF